MINKLLIALLIITAMPSALAMDPVYAYSADAKDPVEEASAVRLAIEHYLIETLQKKTILNTVRLEHLKELLRERPRQSAIDDALECAFKTDNEPAAELLIKHGAHHDFLEMKHRYHFPLWHAAVHGWVNLCRLLLEKNAQVNARMDPCESDPARPTTALGAAVLHGRARVVELLLTHKADAKIIEKKGRGILHIAAFGLQQAFQNIPNPKYRAQFLQGRDYESTCKLLIAYGADKNLKDDSGKTAHDGYAMLEILKPNSNN